MQTISTMKENNLIKKVEMISVYFFFEGFPDHILGFQDNWQKMKQSEQFILYLQKHV